MESPPVVLWVLMFLSLGLSIFFDERMQAHWKRFKNRRNLRIWQDAAASCGLQVEKTSSSLLAYAGPVDVRIDAVGGNDQDALITVVAPGPPDFKKVRIRLEAPDPTQWVREIQTGDARFDRTFFVEGPVRLVFALLDERTRHLLLQARSKGRLEISLGELRAVTSARKVPSVLPFLVELCQRFAQPMNVLRRVAENANRDSEEGVRLHNLLLLAHELPGDPVTVEALRTACSDPGTEIRLRAAKELGAEGRPILLEFAESRADDALSAGAVLILDRELPFERARAILDDALRNRRLQTARACLEVLGRSRATEAVETLAKVMLEEEGELAAAAALALETTRSPEAEPPLILALRREPKDLQVAAANVLGRIGSAEAVLPLKELADRSPRNSELLQATRQAVAEIQSRLPGASPGQLSLAAAEVGQLSLAQAEAGQLSIATDAGGQLSLPTVESGQLLLGEDGEESVQKD